MSDFISGRLREILFLALGAIALIALFTHPVAAAPGDLDLSFGGTGKVSTALGGGDDRGNSVAVQSDGKIVVAGSSYDGSSNIDFALVRYNPNGSLDPSFNGTGKVTTAIGNGDDYGSSVAVAPDGKIIVAGSSYNGSSNADFALVRYNSNGSLDPSFNGNGKVTTAIGNGGDVGNSVAVQPDGKIVVGGSSLNGSTPHFALVRYNPNGSLDLSFNGTGKVTTAIGNSSSEGRSLAVQPDGKIIVAGYSYNGGNYEDFALVRYNPNGSLDPSFNGTGKVTTAIGNSSDIGHSVAVQPDGKIVIAGSSYNGSGYPDFALVRYNPNGSLDASFNGTGKVTTVIGVNYDDGNSVAVQPNGKIIVAGSSYSDGSYEDFALVRYNPNGSLDPSFNGTGKVTTAIGSGDDYGRSVTVQPDGKVIVVGHSYYGSNGEFALVRYLGDPPAQLAITFQPQSQTVTAGQTVTFTVGATGYPPPTYQWQYNGSDLPGETGPTLTIPLAQFFPHNGNYTVVVRNPSGQVTSAVAKLSVMSNLRTFSPVLPTYTLPQAPAGTDSLVLITHGRTPTAADWQGQLDWLNGMKNSIQQVVPANWAVITYLWESDSTCSVFTVADGVLLARATRHGKQVGDELLLQGLSRPGGKWQHIHFIAHSAGSELIETASRIVKPNVSQSAPIIHTTFLDPFTGTSDGNRSRYGGNSNWSDNYFSFSPDTWDHINHRTFGSMTHAHNVNVTGLDPFSGERQIDQYLASQYSPNSTPATLIPSTFLVTSTHGWPIEFYQNTIPTPPPEYEGYGFPLSAEAGGWANQGSRQVGNSPAYVLPASIGQTGISQGTSPVTVGSATNFSILPRAVSQTGAVQINGMGFTAITGSAPPSPPRPGVADSSTPAAAASPPPVGTPAWISIPIDLTSNMSFVQFDAEFTSQPGAIGMLSIYWNDVEIGQIEEQASLPGVQSYTFDIPSAFLDRSNTLGFRLDQFSGVTSSVSVTNVVTGFGGLANPPKLKIETVPGVPKPVLTVTGTQNFTYLVETSPDLVNWEPMAAVTLDTGVNAALTDPEATGLQLRFYRAVSP